MRWVGWLPDRAVTGDVLFGFEPKGICQHAAEDCSEVGREMHRVGPNCASWPNILTACNPYICIRGLKLTRILG